MREAPRHRLLAAPIALVLALLVGPATEAGGSPSSSGPYPSGVADRDPAASHGALDSDLAPAPERAPPRSLADLEGGLTEVDPDAGQGEDQAHSLGPVGVAVGPALAAPVHCAALGAAVAAPPLQEWLGHICSSRGPPPPHRLG
jgi:hypothetical protein